MERLMYVADNAVDDVNQKLAEGWKIKTIVPLKGEYFTSHSSQQSSVIYVVLEKD